MKKLLVVVDYQNDSVCGSMGFAKAVSLETPIYNKIRKYQKDNQDVLFTLDTHYDDSYETKEIMCDTQKYQNGWELYGKVKELKNEKSICISKHTCGSLDLLEFLLRQQYDEVEFVGIVTNMCVLVNAVLARTALPDSAISIDAECVASQEEELHGKALDILAKLQIKINNREKEH
ncbi:isochorismatase family protein [Paludicola sp. MB14-C6]|uniref:cysteine hydrolase family protein n=1 Tax=Paludihabitans sp. MB14-C6 TaxID=3070656 RepID=UPI0027DB8825|nr:isochorismatase family protein [Paludicola sp. MB14-C6]WMJ22516.1 isochorismatase family protein [Paludicola sp. MB14-C6]